MATKSKNGPSKDEARNLTAMLRGAFAGPPTPLKDIPTRKGESRAVKRKVAAKKKPPKK